VASCTFVATKQPAAIALRGWVVKRRRSASHSFPLGFSVFLWAVVHPARQKHVTANGNGLPANMVSGGWEKSPSKFWCFENNA